MDFKKTSCIYCTILKNLQNNNEKGRTVSPLLTEGLLEKLILAKTKHMDLWKFY
jgi:hypothetical protein